MLLVDEILEMDEEHAVGTLHLTGDRVFLPGPLPGQPDHAAVFRLEALAQVGGVALLSIPEFKGKTAVYTGIVRRNSAPWPSRAIRSGWR